MKTIACSLLLLVPALSHAASVDEWLKTGLLHPDTIAAVSERLELTAEQQGRLSSQLEEARKQAGPLEQTVKEEQKALNRLLQDTTATADAASAQLTKLLNAEAAVKQLQLRTLVGVRDVLTPEQLQKARKLNPHGVVARGHLEAKLNEKANQLRAAVEGLGIPTTEAMKARGGEIEQLIKSGELAQADAALDQLIKDSHFKELEAEPAEVDFSKFEPGDTDVETLRQRYESLQAAGQEIINLPLLRELLQAKEAFEEAKAAQDAEKVGRILTYVEGRLKKD
jgi:Spy/CpxP family protein refolding chaperone